MEIIGLRLMSVYGGKEEAKAEYANLVSQFCWDIGRRVRPVIYGDGQQTRDFLHVTDAVEAMKRALTMPVSSDNCYTCDVGTGEATALLKLVSCINEAFSTARGSSHSYVEPQRNVRPPHKYERSGRARTAVHGNLLAGFKPRVTIEEGVRDLVDQFRTRKSSIRRTSSDIYWSKRAAEGRQLPDPTSPGDFNKGQYTAQDWYDSRWASHPDVIDKVANGKYEELTPKVSEFIPTLNCPFRCPHCHFRKHKQDRDVWDEARKNPAVEMPLDDAKIYADKLIEGKCFAIHFTGGGEPTVYPHLADLAKHCYERGGVLSISTNGTFKGQIQPEQLIELKFQRVRISLDTIKRHHEFHGYRKEERLLDEVLRNIERLIRAKKAVSAETKLIIGIVFDERNYEEIPDLGETICGFGGIDHVIIRPVQDYYGDMNIRVPDEVIQKSNDLVEQLRERLSHHQIGLIFPKYRRPEQGRKDRDFCHCRAYGLIGGVWPEGKMYMCTETNGVDGFEIGSLQFQSLENIYSGARCRSIRDRLSAEKFQGCPVTARPLPLNHLFEKIEQEKETRKDEVLRWMNQILVLHPRPDPWIQI